MPPTCIALHFTIVRLDLGYPDGILIYNITSYLIFTRERQKNDPGILPAAAAGERGAWDGRWVVGGLVIF